MIGLASALTGSPCEITAETLYPSRLALISRRDFLGFLTRHPDVYQIVTEELGRQIGLACEQLRTVALSSSAPEKLARLLLEWSQNGQTTESGPASASPSPMRRSASSSAPRAKPSPAP